MATGAASVNGHNGHQSGSSINPDDDDDDDDSFVLLSKGSLPRRRREAPSITASKLLPQSKLNVQDNAIKTLHALIPLHYHQQALDYCDSAAMKMIQSNRTIRSPTGFFIKVLHTFQQQNDFCKKEGNKNASTCSPSSSLGKSNDNTTANTTTCTRSERTNNIMDSRTSNQEEETAVVAPAAAVAAECTDTLNEKSIKGMAAETAVVAAAAAGVPTTMPVSSSSLPTIAAPSTAASSHATTVKDKNKNNTIDNNNYVVLPKSKFKLQDEALKTLHSLVPLHQHKQALDYCDAVAMTIIQRNHTLRSPTGYFSKVIQTFQKNNKLVNENDNTSSTSTTLEKSDSTATAKCETANNNMDRTSTHETVGTEYTGSTLNDERKLHGFCQTVASSVVPTAVSPPSSTVAAPSTASPYQITVKDNDNNNVQLVIARLRCELQDTKDQLQSKSIQCEELTKQVNLSKSGANKKVQELETLVAKLEENLRIKDDTIKSMAGTIKVVQLESQKSTKMLDEVRRELMFVQQEKKTFQEQHQQQQKAALLSEAKCTNMLAAKDAELEQMKQDLKRLEMLKFGIAAAPRITPRDDARKADEGKRQSSSTIVLGAKKEPRAAAAGTAAGSREEKLFQPNDTVVRILKRIDHGIQNSKNDNSTPTNSSSGGNSNSGGVANETPSTLTLCRRQEEHHLYREAARINFGGALADGASVATTKAAGQMPQQHPGRSGRGPAMGQQGRGGRGPMRGGPIQQPIKPNHCQMQIQPPPKPTTQQQAANAPDPTPQEGAVLTASALASVAPEIQKTMIGERLYPLILQSQPDLAGKLTGMLLEMDNSGLLHLLTSPDALNSRISEALKVLEAHQTGKACPPIQTSKNGASGSTTTASTTTMQLCRLLLMGHHILDPGEVHLVQQKASKFDLGGYIKLGYPGYILVEGLADNCTFFVETIVQQQTKLPNNDRNTKGPNARTDSTTFTVAGKILTTVMTGVDLDAKRVFAKKKLTEIEPSREGVEMMREFCSRVDLGEYYIDST